MHPPEQTERRSVSLALRLRWHNDRAAVDRVVVANFNVGALREAAVEIKTWLESLALSEYEPAFREHQITADLLAELSDDDLRSMGIAALGARKRLLKAIAALRVTVSEAAAPATASYAPTERRHLTVMFADMVGSTALSTEFDPEDLGTLLAGFHTAIGTQVAAFGGFTARSFGDGLFGLFRLP